MDTERINSLLACAEAADPDYPWLERDFYDPLLIALGDDEEEVIQFIKDADDDTKQWLWSMMDELYEKFPSKEMDAVLDELKKVVEL